MSEMADTFAQALLRKADASYRGGSGRNPARERIDRIAGVDDEPDATSLTDSFGDQSGGRVVTADGSATNGTSENGASENGAAANRASENRAASETSENGAAADGAGEAEHDGPTANGTSADGAAAAEEAGGDASSEASDAEPVSPADDAEPPSGETGTATAIDRSAGGPSVEASGVTAAGGTQAASATGGVPAVQRDDLASAPARQTFEADASMTAFARGTELRDRGTVVRGFVDAIEGLPGVTRRMLDHYRSVGTARPIAAHIAADGSGDRAFAYARNGTLRQSGVIEHVGRGLYSYRLPALVRQVYAGADEQELAETVAEIEGQAGLVAEE